MIYNFDEIPDRRSTESIKWHYFAEDVLPMWVADMDFVCPEPVIRELQQRVAHGVFGYAGDLPGLREVVVDRMQQRYQWRVSPESLVFIPGVVTGFFMAAHSLIGRGEGLLIQPPVYMPFLSVAGAVQGIGQEAQLVSDANGYYSWDERAFEAAITDQTRMFLLCNPHNPVGRVYNRPELERMAEISLRHNLVICSDEIHSDLVFSGHKHHPIASISPEIEKNTITLIAPSKTFNIAGLACSVAIIPNRDLRKRFIKGGLGMVHGVNLLGLVAAKAAYEHGQEWLDQLLVYLEANRDFLCQFVKDQLPGVKMFCPEGTYLAWLDFRGLGLEGKPCEFIIDKARVGLNDGAAFGSGGDGFVRLNFGCPRSMLVDALERIKRAVSELKPGIQPGRPEGI